MKTKVKILISIIAACIILGVVVLSMVLVFTDTVHAADNSSIVIEYAKGHISADVNIKKHDTRVYIEEGKEPMVSIDEFANIDYQARLDSSTNKSKEYNLGEFNVGQLLDKTNAKSILTVDVSLNKQELGEDTFVRLYYQDKGQQDSNIFFTVKAMMYKDGATCDLGIETFNIVNGSWNIENDQLFSLNKPLTRVLGDTNYTGVIITVEVELVSYLDYARLDGEFKLELNNR